MGRLGQMGLGRMLKCNGARGKLDTVYVHSISK